MNLKGSRSGPLLHAIAMSYPTGKTGLDRLKEIKDQLDEIREDFRADMFGTLGKLEWPDRRLCYELDPVITKVKAMIKANEQPPERDWKVTVTYTIRARDYEDVIESVKTVSSDPETVEVTPA